MRNRWLAVILTSACVNVAHAGFVDVVATSVSNYQTLNTIFGGTAYNGVIVGQINLSLTNSTGVSLNGSWIGYCTEFDQHIQLGGASQTYEVRSLSDVSTPGAGMGAMKADAIARMYSAAAGQQYAADTSFAVAFQLSIWEVLNDFDGTLGSLDLSSSAFQVVDALSFTINANVAALFAAAADTGGARASLHGLANSSFQDQIIEVPTPSALALLGLAGLARITRRRA